MRTSAQSFGQVESMQPIKSLKEIKSIKNVKNIQEVTLPQIADTWLIFIVFNLKSYSLDFWCHKFTFLGKVNWASEKYPRGNIVSSLLFFFLMLSPILFPFLVPYSACYLSSSSGETYLRADSNSSSGVEKAGWGQVRVRGGKGARGKVQVQRGQRGQRGRRLHCVRSPWLKIANKSTIFYAPNLPKMFHSWMWCLFCW